MYEFNLHRANLTPHIRRAHRERGQVAFALVRATVRAVEDWATSIAAARARRRLRRQTVRQLRALSDRTLRDIGISRGAIWSVANDLVNAAAGTAASDHEPPQAARPALVLAPVSANQNQQRIGHARPTPVAVGCG